MAKGTGRFLIQFFCPVLFSVKEGVFSWRIT